MLNLQRGPHEQQRRAIDGKWMQRLVRAAASDAEANRGAAAGRLEQAEQQHKVAESNSRHAGQRQPERLTSF